jgi:hypothetical protein
MSTPLFHRSEQALVRREDVPLSWGGENTAVRSMAAKHDRFKPEAPTRASYSAYSDTQAIMYA